MAGERRRSLTEIFGVDLDELALRLLVEALLERVVGVSNFLIDRYDFLVQLFAFIDGFSIFTFELLELSLELRLVLLEFTLVEQLDQSALSCRLER